MNQFTSLIQKNVVNTGTVNTLKKKTHPEFRIFETSKVVFKLEDEKKENVGIRLRVLIYTFVTTLKKSGACSFHSSD